MDAISLRLFLRIADLGSVTAAARDLAMSPAAASARLGKLEQTLGFRLFNRTTRAVSLTTDGAEFLPYARQSLETLESGIRAVSGEGAAAQGAPGGTILVVEDDEDLRRVLCNRLLAEGYTVHDARDGEQARSLFDLRRREIDLLLTDSVLPGRVQGPELVEHVKAVAPEMPVVFLSGYVGWDDEATNTAADVRLDKPIEKGVLLETVRRMIAAR